MPHVRNWKVRNLLQKLLVMSYSVFSNYYPSNAVSRSQYDAVKNQYQHAMAQLKQAQSNYACESVIKPTITSYVPHKNGVITERNIEVGQVLAAGQVAYQLAIAGEREVVIGVPEQAVGEIKVGQEATGKFMVTTSGYSFAGYGSRN